MDARDAKPLVGRIDLSEAYAALRKRGRALRRRRIFSSLLAVAVLAGVFTVVGYYYINSVPLPDQVSLPESTTVYYSDGTTVMARLGERVRIPVDVAALPRYIEDAVVAAEDPGFWDDSGARLSRQYARAAMDIEVGTASGKARALVMAWKLEDSFTKQEILGFYLNTVYFGRGAYGIEAAAHAYFGRPAAQLTTAEAVLLAGVLRSPGNAAYDPTVSPSRTAGRFKAIAEAMVGLNTLSRAEADALTVPEVRVAEVATLQSGLDQPTGLVVAQVLAELRQAPIFAGKPAGYLENGGFSIVTTLNAKAQDLLEQTVDETVAGSVMSNQPHNLQAAAVVIEPGTGRVLAYYGGHDGTGADYAGWHIDASGVAVGYGAHPPGQTIGVYTLAAALKANISVKSTWDSAAEKQFPASGRHAANPVRDFGTAPCQPRCTLAEAATAALNVPFYGVGERVGPRAIIDAARNMGIESMWIPESATTSRQRVDLQGRSSAAVSPTPFGPDIALGGYPVTVVDQANAMATLAAGNVRASAHVVRRVTRAGLTLLTEKSRQGASPLTLSRAEVDDLTWVMSQNPAGQLPDGRPSATKIGNVPLRTSAIEISHAWIIGFTRNLAMAVWVGNVDTELPLRSRDGSRVSGSGLPAQMYRSFMTQAGQQLALPVLTFRTPTFTGDVNAGNVG